MVSPEGDVASEEFLQSDATLSDSDDLHDRGDATKETLRPSGEKGKEEPPSHLDAPLPFDVEMGKAKANDFDHLDMLSESSISESEPLLDILGAHGKSADLEEKGSWLSDEQVAIFRGVGFLALGSALIFLAAISYQHVMLQPTAMCQISGDWSSWSSCSATCQGQQHRVRTMSGNCQDSMSDAVQQRSCQPRVECPTEGCKVGSWMAWRGCDAEGFACGEGASASRYRKITHAPGLLGEGCPPLVESVPCSRTVPCPVICQHHLGPWEDWSTCSAMCDVGHRWRLRKWIPNGHETLHAICQAHGQDLEDCEPDGGSCPCHRPEGAKACEVPNVLTEKNHKNASEHWFVLDLKFGLQQPAERRHFHMSDAFSQKILLQSLEKSGKPVLMTNLPDFPYKGFRLVSVRTKDSLVTADPLHQLRSMRSFPAEVAFQGFGGSLPQLKECLKSWFSLWLHVSQDKVMLHRSSAHAIHGWLTLTLRLKLTCRSVSQCDKNVPEKALHHAGKRCVRAASFTTGGLV